MVDKMGYPYKAGPKKILTYQYSKFYGYEFLKQYKAFRIKTLRSLKSKLRKKKLNGIIDDYLRELKFKNPIAKGLRETLSENVLNEKMLGLALFMLYSFPKDKKSKERVDSWLMRLVKRYEVSRKLDKDNKISLDAYVIFAAILALAYNKLQNLKFLNCLLKLNDVLCPAYNRISNKCIPLLYFAVNAELEGVKKLFNKKDLTL